MIEKGVQDGAESLFSVLYIFDIYWFSTNPAATVLAASLVSVVLYVFAMNYFFARGKPEARGTASSLFFIWAVFILFMGISFMLLSAPITGEAAKAYNEILVNCETAQRARDLFVASQALQALRQSPACKKMMSIEQCVGFQSSVYTQVLKSMESD